MVLQKFILNYNFWQKPQMHFFSLVAIFSQHNIFSKVILFQNFKLFHSKSFKQLVISLKISTLQNAQGEKKKSGLKSKLLNIKPS